MAYAAKKRKKRTSAKKSRMKHNGDVFERAPEQSICNMY